MAIINNPDIIFKIPPENLDYFHEIKKITLAEKDELIKLRQNIHVPVTKRLKQLIWQSTILR